MKYKNQKSKMLHIPEEKLGVCLPQDYPWKVLSHLTEDLKYLFDEGEYKRITEIVRKRDFSAYLSLSEEWDAQSKRSTESSIAVMRAKTQVSSLLKKFQFKSDSKSRRSAAIEKFLTAEQACGAFNRKGRSFVFLDTDSTDEASVFQYARQFLSKLLGEGLPHPEALTLWSRHGPGANLDTQYGSTSQYFKYSEWPYSCTLDALQEARSAIKRDERWLGALEDDYRHRYNIPKYAILDQEKFWSTVITIVPGNRICFVPKNALIDRSIAIEPSLNLYLQLGVDGFMRRRLKRWGVDLDSQAKNQELARLGSLKWEDPNCYCTLDLASASDTISLRCCAALLPQEWYNYLIRIRSPLGELDGNFIVYDKISSMGNGFTFALETAIFTSIVYGVMKAAQGSFVPDDIAVYGDDIIVPKQFVNQTIRCLNLAGFEINVNKSFFEGPFRESCGADWFRGLPVRAVYLTSLPTTVKGLWTDLNRLRRILSLRWMVEDSQSESYIAKYIPDLFRGYVGPISDEDFDSYRHSAIPNGMYDSCLWKFKRLVVTLEPQRGNKFLFRKLMHDLRGQPQPLSIHSRSLVWRDGKLTGGGSRFAITRNDRVKVSASYSVADIWRTKYTESYTL